MNKFELRKNDTIRRICKAYAILVSKKDINSITVSDIAKKSGVYRSTVYNHFNNVQEISEYISSKYSAYLQRKIGTYIDIIENDNYSVDSIKLVIDDYVCNYIENAVYIPLITAFRINHSLPNSEHYYRIVGKIINKTNSIDDTAEYGKGILAAINVILSEWIKEKSKSKEEIEQTILNFLLAKYVY